MREPRDLSARIVLVNDVALGCLHEFRLGARHCLQRCIAVAALDRLFDGADRAAHLGATRLVDNGAAGNLARRLLGGRSIGHVLKYPSAKISRWEVRVELPPFNRLIDAIVFFPVFCEDATLGKPTGSHDGAAQRTAAAGLRPPPLAPL